MEIKDEVLELIEHGDLIDSDGTTSCDNCESQVSIYHSKYDEEVTAYRCNTCESSAWLNDIGSKYNPRRCEYCREFVTDEDITGHESVECTSTDANGEKNCEQLTHNKCVEFCDQCGWFCEEHQADLLQCDSCSAFHLEDDIVSFDSDFVDTWGNICKGCFNNENESQDPSESLSQSTSEELRQVIAVQVSPPLASAAMLATSKPSSRGRIDSSIYLSHFLGRRDNFERDTLETLISVINTGKLEAQPTGYFRTYQGNQAQTAASLAVCFTEGRLEALEEHSRNFSEFGIAFSKFWLHKNFKAAPAVYIHEEIIKVVRDTIPSELVPYINKIDCGGSYDFHHEREWRTPAHVMFQVEDVKLVFVPLQYQKEFRDRTQYSGQVVCINQLRAL